MRLKNYKRRASRFSDGTKTDKKVAEGAESQGLTVELEAQKQLTGKLGENTSPTPRRQNRVEQAIATLQNISTYWEQIPEPVRNQLIPFALSIVLRGPLGKIAAVRSLIGPVLNNTTSTISKELLSKLLTELVKVYLKR